MSKIPDMYIQKFEYTDTLDKLTKVLQMYALMINLEIGKIYLRPRLVEVLAFYILRDYSNETKELIIQTLGIEKANLNQINSELTKKGYLRIDQRSFRKKHLSPAMLQIKDYFTNDESFCLLGFKFEKEEHRKVNE